MHSDDSNGSDMDPTDNLPTAGATPLCRSCEVEYVADSTGSESYVAWPYDWSPSRGYCLGCWLLAPKDLGELNTIRKSNALERRRKQELANDDD
jgi:hypothetical protein